MSIDFADDDKLLTKGEVAHLCRVDVRTVERWFTTGKLVGQRTPRHSSTFRGNAPVCSCSRAVASL